MRTPKCCRIALGIGTALISQLSFASSANLRGSALAGELLSQTAAGTVRYVEACSDSFAAGSQSIRDIVASSSSGDVVDLSHLAAIQCSFVYLDHGEIVIPQQNLTIAGSADAHIGFSGNHQTRVFDHVGSGTLTIANVEIRNGLVTGSGDARGGCIYSKGSVSLVQSKVSGCVAHSDAEYASGGGIYAFEGATVLRSQLYDNTASAKAKPSSGGAISTRYAFRSKYSTFHGNTADFGGGIFAGVSGSFGSLKIENTTIDGNTALRAGGGIYLHASGAVIQESTISGNIATDHGSAIEFYGNSFCGGGGFSILDTTIAFNQVTSPTGGGGAIHDACDGGEEVTLNSSIVSNNVSGGISPAIFLVQGSSNLIENSLAQLPQDTMSEDPLLGPLQANGGPTSTHMLMAGSPAIGRGFNASGKDWDQRGNGNPRASNGSVDIGSVQREVIFANAFE